MTRYSMLYEEARLVVRNLHARLAEVESTKELYRAFIHEEGHAEAFLRWLAKKQGLKLECLREQTPDEVAGAQVAGTTSPIAR